MFREVEAIVGQFEPALGGVGLDESSHHLEQVQQIAAVFGIVDGIGLGKAIPAGAEHAGLVHFAVIGEKESAVCEGAVFQDKVIRRKLSRLYKHFEYFVALLIFSGSQRPVRNRIQVGVIGPCAIPPIYFGLCLGCKRGFPPPPLIRNVVSCRFRC